MNLRKPLLTSILLLATACDETEPVVPYVTWLVGNAELTDGEVLVPSSGAEIGWASEYAAPVGKTAFVGVGRTADATAELADLLVVSESEGARILAQNTATTSYEVEGDRTHCVLTLGFDCTDTLEYAAIYLAVEFDSPGRHTFAVIDRGNLEATPETFTLDAAEAEIDWSETGDGNLVFDADPDATFSSLTWPAVYLGAKGLPRKSILAAMDLEVVVDGEPSTGTYCWGSGCRSTPAIGCPGTYSVTLTARAPDVGVISETRTIEVTVTEDYLRVTRQLSENCE